MKRRKEWDSLSARQKRRLRASLQVPQNGEINEERMERDESRGNNEGLDGTSENAVVEGASRNAGVDYGNGDLCTDGASGNSVVEGDFAVGTSSNVSPPNNLKAELTKWALESRIPKNHVSSLLKILRPYHPQLPQDYRTLLGTPTHVDSIEEMTPGIYLHFGLVHVLQKLIPQQSDGERTIHLSCCTGFTVKPV
ncbi:uncharacterized protein LOC103520208 [Diaphorina citri]|uniref:Uncharacterized protein LOC103520208 n=1 Tax=Diaphorina citri TaxID=121845 RepID=A0A1S3DKH1_DIACI|nr:uncharacterized protein LOC103520208 [Diaphorina citri]